MGASIINIIWEVLHQMGFDHWTLIYILAEITKAFPSSSDLGKGEPFKRILSSILKGGQIKKNDDGSVDLSIHMRLDQKRWNTLEEYMNSSTVLTEDMFLHSVGYIEEAMYAPTITDKIVMAWSDYIYTSWGLAMLGISVALIWSWNHMTRRRLVAISILASYLYEGVISYREAEKQELEKFLSAVNRCKWYYLTCDEPKPDPNIFLNHMNPLKIGIRMCTIFITEPMLAINVTWETIANRVTGYRTKMEYLMSNLRDPPMTESYRSKIGELRQLPNMIKNSDGLWFPFSTITYGTLILTFNLILGIFLIMVVCNYILNVPFSLFHGILSVNATDNNRMFADAANFIRQPSSDTANSGNATNNNREPSPENSGSVTNNNREPSPQNSTDCTDRVLAILDRCILFTQALSGANNKGTNNLQINNYDNIRKPKICTKGQLPKKRYVAVRGGAAAALQRRRLQRIAGIAY